MKQEIELLDSQLELLRDTTTREILYLAGFGAGKTEGGCFKACHLARLNIGERSVFTEPTHPMVRDVLIPKMVEVVNKLKLSYILKFSPHPQITLKFKTGEHTILFRSGENYKRLLGIDIAFMIVDELDSMNYEIANQLWLVGLSRLRAGKVFQMIGLTTPEGFKFAYDYFVSKNKDLSRRRIIVAKTRDNHFLPDHYVDMLLANYPPHLIEAYLEGKFVNMVSGMVYQAFDDKLNNSNYTIQHLKESHQTIEIGMDFNVDGMSGIVFFRDKENRPHAVYEFIGAGGTQDIIDDIKTVFPWAYAGKDNWRVIIYPDRSGNARDTRNPDETDITMLENAGFDCIYPSGQYPIKTRINTVNRLFCNGLGVRGMFINSRECPRLSECVQQQPYKNGKPEKRTGKHDMSGPNDAMGYFCCSEYPIGCDIVEDPFG